MSSILLSVRWYYTNVRLPESEEMDGELIAAYYEAGKQHVTHAFYNGKKWFNHENSNILDVYAWCKMPYAPTNNSVGIPTLLAEKLPEIKKLQSSQSDDFGHAKAYFSNLLQSELG